MTEARKYLAYLLHHLKCRVIWFKKWVILIRTIPADEPFPAMAAGYVIRQAGISDYPALIAAYPVEFSHHLPEVMKRRQLMRRAYSNAHCFMIVDDYGDIKGATWCMPYRNALIQPEGVSQDSLFEMINTFIVPEARGKGLSESLRRYAIATMASLGYRAAISFVWYSRAGSLKMNLNTGSRVLGEKTLYSVMGFRWTRYRRYVAIDKLPIKALGKVVLLGQNGSVLYPYSLELSRYGISAVFGLTNSGALARMKYRMFGCNVTDFSDSNGQGISVLPVLGSNENGFIIPLDKFGEQVLLAFEQSGLPKGYQPLRLAADQLSFSETEVSGLSAAVLHAGGMSDCFHSWAAE